MSINIDFYNDNYEDLTNQYNSLTFESVHEKILDIIPKSGTILDMGCGSGRDANALSQMGLNVVAVDPSENMLSLAKKNFSSEQITWIQDKMPTMEKVKELNMKFDFILLSAVWMHVEEKDRKEAFNSLKKMLKKDGQMAIYLRHGNFSDNRKEIPVSLEEIKEYAKDIKTNTVSANEDSFKRDVSWELIVVKNTPKYKNKYKKRF